MERCQIEVAQATSENGTLEPELRLFVTEFLGTDRFEVRRCLGSGAFGIVFEAFDRERSARVALKLPHERGAQGLYLFKQ